MRRSIFGALLGLGLLGCGGVSDTPTTIPVSGKVTLDGQPLASAAIRFYPDDPKVLPATGTTDAQGVYKLFTSSTEGAQPGSYKVAIEHYSNNDGTPIVQGPDTDLEQMKMAGQAKLTLPEKFASFELTELKAEIKPGQTEPIDFALTK